jgi:hypothetical protein
MHPSHPQLGIDVIYFAELLISSGIVLCDEVVVITRVLICASHALVTLMSLYTMLRHSGFFSSCFLLQVRWVSFHSGYDFGYLMKLLTCKPLPHEEVRFVGLFEGLLLIHEMVLHGVVLLIRTISSRISSYIFHKSMTLSACLYAVVCRCVAL